MTSICSLKQDDTSQPTHTPHPHTHKYWLTWQSHAGQKGKNFPRVSWVADFTIWDLNCITINKCDINIIMREEYFQKKNKGSERVSKIIEDASSRVVIIMSFGRYKIWFYDHCNFALDSCRTGWFNCTLTRCKDCFLTQFWQIRSQNSSQSQSGGWNSNRGLRLQGK